MLGLTGSANGFEQRPGRVDNFLGLVVAEGGEVDEVGADSEGESAGGEVLGGVGETRGQRTPAELAREAQPARGTPMRYPCRLSSAASLRVLFAVQRKNDSGSPRATGSTSCSKALSRSG